MSERKELTEYKRNLPCVSEAFSKTDTIRILKRKGYREIFGVLAAYWRFAALTAAFAVILMTLYFVFFCDTEGFDDIECSVDENTSEIARTDEETIASVFEDETLAPPMVINESRIDIDSDTFFGDIAETEEFLLSGGGVSVLIVHSHTSEKVSQSMSVLDAGDAIAKLLTASGINAVHQKEKYDENGRVGAYARMKNGICEMKEDNPELVLVIDIHGSDNDYPFSLNVGTSQDYAWKENFRIASALYNTMERSDCIIRLVPQSLGQDNGVLSINISIGNETADDKHSRELISQVASGIIKLFKESTSE